MILIICVLHVTNAFRPVHRSCSDTDFGPPFGHQYRQGIVPRRRELPTRPVIQIDVGTSSLLSLCFFGDMVPGRLCRSRHWRLQVAG